METLRSSPPTTLLPGPAPARTTFSSELNALIARFDDRPVRLAEILEATDGRGYHLLLLLIALPFASPLPLPGLSVPFGLVVAMIGLRLAIDDRPWLPPRLLRQEVSTSWLRRALKATSGLMRGLEFFVRPRLQFVPDHRIFSRVAGGLIAVSGVMLMLPFPIPFSNALPAWTVLLLSAGALGRDGLFFFAGGAMFVLSAAFFALVAFGGVEAFELLRWIFRG